MHNYFNTVFSTTFGNTSIMVHH